MADVLLTSTEEVIQLVSVNGASQSDITSAVNAHSALTTGVHGVGASTVDSAVARDAAITAHNASATAHGLGGSTVNDQTLKDWTESGAYEMTAITYHVTNTKAVSTATVKWPDGSAGTFTTTAYNTTASPARVNAYTITHTASGKTVTQAACTLNGDGEITVKPALTVA